MLARKVRMLTQEIRDALRSRWRTQAELADLMQCDQRTINSRVQCMWRFGELQKRNGGYRKTQYKLRKARVLPPRLHVPAVRGKSARKPDKWATPIYAGDLLHAIRLAAASEALPTCQMLQRVANVLEFEVLGFEKPLKGAG